MSRAEPCSVLGLLSTRFSDSFGRRMSSVYHKLHGRDLGVGIDGIDFLTVFNRMTDYSPQIHPP